MGQASDSDSLQRYVSDLFDRALKSCAASNPEEAAQAFRLCWKTLINLETAKPVLFTMTMDDLFESSYRLLIRTANHFS